jgi:hypothetical protein
MTRPTLSLAVVALTLFVPLTVAFMLPLPLGALIRFMLGIRSVALAMVRMRFTETLPFSIPVHIFGLMI